MKSTFRSNYPGELLDENSTPGPRYWASIFSFLRTDGRIRWLPWVQIISEKQHTYIEETKGGRFRERIPKFWQ